MENKNTAKLTTDLSGIGKTAEAIETTTRELRKLLLLFLERPVTEAGLWLGNEVLNHRIRRMAKVMAKTKKILQNAGTEIKPVSLKVFLPLAEACSLDEEEMTGRWANLLAAAVCGNPLLPSYVRILSELTPVQARVLDLIHKIQADVGAQLNSKFPILAVDIKELRGEANLPEGDYGRILENLERLSLICRRSPSEAFGLSPYHDPDPNEYYIGLDGFGADFLEACTRPLA